METEYYRRRLGYRVLMYLCVNVLRALYACSCSLLSMICSLFFSPRHLSVCIAIVLCYLCSAA